MGHMTCWRRLRNPLLHALPWGGHHLKPLQQSSAVIISPVPGIIWYYPNLNSSSPRREASSVIRESLFLHYLILGRPLEM